MTKKVHFHKSKRIRLYSPQNDITKILSTPLNNAIISSFGLIREF